MNDELSRILDEMKRGASPQTGSGGKMAYGVPTPSARSQGTVEKVLEEALDVLADEGVSGLSFRALARRCDMRLSNLQYYFTTQEDLLSAVTRYALTQNLEALARTGILCLEAAPERLSAYVDFRLDRASDRHFGMITTGLRDLAQRVDGPANAFAEVCRFHRDVVMQMIRDVSPELDQNVAEQRAVLISAMIDAAGPICGRNYVQPEGLHDAIRREVTRLAHSA